jgi:hypothetical protein
LRESGLPPSVAAATYGALGEVFDDLKLVRCPRSLDPTLVTLPSMSLIPSAPFGGDDIGSVSDLKLRRCPRSLAAALAALPSMSIIPFAPFSRDDVENLGAICWTTRAVEKPRMSAFGLGHSIRQRIR